MRGYLSTYQIFHVWYSLNGANMWGENPIFIVILISAVSNDNRLFHLAKTEILILSQKDN